MIVSVVHTSSDAFPDVYASTFWIPYATLGKRGPGNIKFPNSRRVANDCSRHFVEGETVERAVGLK
jgi:hypothetical protein